MATSPSLHALLLLSDSALPLGSFAHSSGLESFLAHSKNVTSPQPTPASRLAAFNTFSTQSLHNIASTSLPYVLAAYNKPSSLSDLDNDFDASTPCSVARRASIAQGRALVAVWERALSASAAGGEAADAISTFATALKSGAVDDFGFKLEAHFPPLFGAVCRALALTQQEASYIFLLNHAKAVLSAAVRASVMGPYQSQGVLANGSLQKSIGECIERESGTNVQDASVTVPPMDLWMGRHELLYSRIFNS